MAVFPVLIFGGLVLVFVALVVGLVRCIAKRHYLAATVSGVLALPFAAYFAHAMLGWSIPRAPEAIFQYGLGFAPPAGVASLTAYERQGFHPGADVFLRFQASDEALHHIIAQAHFKPVQPAQFAEALSRGQQRPDWWQPAGNPPTHFWQSSDFAGPYAFHDAFLAQSPDQTVWAFITAFE